MRNVLTINTTDTYGFWVYCAEDVTIDAMVTEIQSLGAGAGTDLTMGVYAMGTNSLLASTGNVAPAQGRNVVALTAPLALTRGTQYYFAIYCARASTNFIRRSGSVMQNIGTWTDTSLGGAAKTNGWRHASTRFAATAVITTIETNPIWIGARVQ